MEGLTVWPGLPGAGVWAEARRGTGRTLKRELSRKELGDGRKSVHCGGVGEMGQGQEERGLKDVGTSRVLLTSPALGSGG